jgi:hypothetical protein
MSAANNQHSTNLTSEMGQKGRDNVNIDDKVRDIEDLMEEALSKMRSVTSFPEDWVGGADSENLAGRWEAGVDRFASLAVQDDGTTLRKIAQNEPFPQAYSSTMHTRFSLPGKPPQHRLQTKARKTPTC